MRDLARDAVFVAGGTGLAPIRSLLEELTRYHPDPVGAPVLRRPRP